MLSKKMHLVFLGAPGAGKGTMASMAAKKFNLSHLSTGEILRQEIKKGSELGLKVKKVVESGVLVNDELVAKILKENIKASRKGFILDGYPRNLKQAEMLDKILAELKIDFLKAIFFEIEKEELVRRLSSRLYCSKCGATFNGYTESLKPKKEGKCDSCRAELIKRKDDSVEVIEKRLGVYEEETKPLIDYYAKEGLLIKINANKGIKENFSQLKKVLG